MLEKTTSKQQNHHQCIPSSKTKPKTDNNLGEPKKKTKIDSFLSFFLSFLSFLSSSSSSSSCFSTCDFAVITAIFKLSTDPFQLFHLFAFDGSPPRTDPSSEQTVSIILPVKRLANGPVVVRQAVELMEVSREARVGGFVGDHLEADALRADASNASVLALSKADGGDPVAERVAKELVDDVKPLVLGMQLVDHRGATHHAIKEGVLGQARERGPAVRRRVKGHAQGVVDDGGKVGV